MEFRHFFLKNKHIDFIYMNIIRPIGYLSLLSWIERLNLVINSNRYSYLKQYKDKYRGARCFIIGTGPSLKKEDLNKIKKEVLIGVNSLCLWKEIVPYIDYFFIGDIYAYRRLAMDLPEGTFLSSYCIRKCGKIGKSNYQELPVSRFNYFVPYTRKFSKDISKVIYDFNSVIFLAIQFAIYAGFSEIYLLGVDCNYNTQKIYAIDHGIRHRKEYMRNVGIDMIENFRFIKTYIEKNNLHVSIFNASDGGMLEVFSRVSIKDILDKN